MSTYTRTECVPIRLLGYRLDMVLVIDVSRGPRLSPRRRRALEDPSHSKYLDVNGK